MDQITIKDLQVFCHHGVFPEEQVLGQKFLVSAVLYTNTREAGLTDDLTKSIHYGLVCQDITALMRKQIYQLLERAAEYVAAELLKKYDRLAAIDLEIKKPWAPISLPLETVSVKIHRAWHKSCLALGSNLGDKKGYLDFAVKELNQRDDIQVERVADYLITAPYGGVAQDDFLNSCLTIKTLLPPLELLSVCQEVEQKAKRERLVHWGPRTLDIDILFYEDWIVDSETLTIPHPELAKRDFVLKPLAQIAPYYRHPILQKTVMQLWKKWEERSK